MNLAEEQVPSLTTTHDGAHAIFGIGSMDSNAMKSGNPKSGIYEAETSKTLDQNGVNPAANQGGIAIVSKAVDVYNAEITGDTACTFPESGGGVTPQAPKFCKAVDAKNEGIPKDGSPNP